MCGDDESPDGAVLIVLSVSIILILVMSIVIVSLGCLVHRKNLVKFIWIMSNVFMICHT